MISSSNSTVDSTYNNYATNKGIYFAALGGLFLGLSVYAHPTSIILIPGFLAYCYFSPMNRNKRALASFLDNFGNYSIIRRSDQRFEIWLVHRIWIRLFRIHYSTQWMAWFSGLDRKSRSRIDFLFPNCNFAAFSIQIHVGLSKGLFFLCAYVIVVTWLGRWYFIFRIRTLCMEWGYSMGTKVHNTSLAIHYSSTWILIYAFEKNSHLNTDYF